LKTVVRKFVFFYIVAFANICSADPAPQTDLVIESNANQEGSGLGPNKILSGDELLNKMGSNLGDTLANELGISATGFGAGASRPVIRGLEGSRVQIVENGLAVNDVSSISADHATGNAISNTRQIEVLRGAAALMYGSSSSGGLINVVNDRIPTALAGEVTGTFNTSYETATQAKTVNTEIDDSVGQIALHLDASASGANDYRIPGYAEQGGPNANWSISPGVPQNVPYYGKLPFSFNNQNNIGFGGSYIATSGYTGLSVDRLNHDYGVPTAAGGFIQQSQNRYDLQHETRDPFDGFSTFKLSISNSQYMHNEFDNNGVPQTHWTNNATELRAVLDHQQFLGWKGSIGVQSSVAKLTATDIATGNSDIVPQTVTNSNAIFWVEQSKMGNFQNSLGARLNNVNQNPNQLTQYAGAGDIIWSGSSYVPPSLVNRQFNLLSYSGGSNWEFTRGYQLGASYTVSERAPNAAELYAYGPHDATATYIIGNSNLQTETSHNTEVTLQKTLNLIQGKAAIYQNVFNNYIYGYYTGNNASGDGYENYPVVVSQQANATIKGVEAEVSYNWKQSGVGSRVFGDASRGTFNSGGNLPLQPAPRLGTEIAHQVNQWQMGASYIHAFQQTRLASFEIGPTPSYNLLNAGISYTEKMAGISWTSYLRMSNLLNQTIRYATTPETVRLYAPQPGRSLMIGLRGAF
jgi:iron complex outermembrane receptor protein